MTRVVGIFGGGQLALMLCQAAKPMGIQTVVFSSPGDNPAFREATSSIEAAYDDIEALDRFIEQVQGGPITIEFENVPVHALQYVESRGIRTTPSSAALVFARDRREEKTLAAKLRIPTTQWVPLAKALAQKHSETAQLLPGILKAAHGGYDGKHQHSVKTMADLHALAKTLDLEKVSWILEKRVEFAYETSVMLARTSNKQVRCFPCSVNEHKDGILHRTYYETGCVHEHVEREAQMYAKWIAAKLDYIGLVSVEFFVTLYNKVLFNEIAPRVHNSGHWTIEGCSASQFTLCLEAICNMPLSTIVPARKVQMVNLIGEEIHGASRYIAEGYAMHDYGKTGIQAGRKMGHVTKVWQ